VAAEVARDAQLPHRQGREGESLCARARSDDHRSLTFRGDNDTHHVALDAGQWRCTCHYFESWGSCVHLLTLQKVFGVMLPEDAQVSIFSAGQPVAST
jgi:hypothetical protein